MITLNIVSPEQKKELDYKIISYYITKFLMLCLVITLLVGTIFLISKYILQKEFLKTTEQTIHAYLKTETFRNVAKEINAKVNSLDTIQSGFVRWTKVINDINRLIPNGINMDRIDISREGRIINLSGRAKTRESLLELKKNIENSTIFENTEFPLKSITEKADISFSVKAKLKPYETLEVDK